MVCEAFGRYTRFSRLNSNVFDFKTRQKNGSFLLEYRPASLFCGLKKNLWLVERYHATYSVCGKISTLYVVLYQGVWITCGLLWVKGGN